MKKFFVMAVMTVLTITASAQVEKGMRYGITFTGTMSKEGTEKVPSWVMLV